MPGCVRVCLAEHDPHRGRAKSCDIRSVTLVTDWSSGVQIRDSGHGGGVTGTPVYSRDTETGHATRSTIVVVHHDR
eukprot:1534208-Rhodomonas_salina.1